MDEQRVTAAFRQERKFQSNAQLHLDYYSFVDSFALVAQKEVFFEYVEDAMDFCRKVNPEFVSQWSSDLTDVCLFADQRGQRFASRQLMSKAHCLAVNYLPHPEPLRYFKAYKYDFNLLRSCGHNIAKTTWANFRAKKPRLLPKRFPWKTF
jgi:hypothetical protein